MGLSMHYLLHSVCCGRQYKHEGPSVRTVIVVALSLFEPNRSSVIPIHRTRKMQQLQSQKQCLFLP